METPYAAFSDAFVGEVSLISLEESKGYSPSMSFIVQNTERDITKEEAKNISDERVSLRRSKVINCSVYELDEFKMYLERFNTNPKTREVLDNSTIKAFDFRYDRREWEKSNPKLDSDKITKLTRDFLIAGESLSQSELMNIRYSSKPIHYPYYKNIDRKKAIEILKESEGNNLIIRPSNVWTGRYLLLNDEFIQADQFYGISIKKGGEIKHLLVRHVFGNRWEFCAGKYEDDKKTFVITSTSNQSVCFYDLFSCVFQSVHPPLPKKP